MTSPAPDLPGRAPSIHPLRRAPSCPICGHSRLRRPTCQRGASARRVVAGLLGRPSSRPLCSIVAPPHLCCGRRLGAVARAGAVRAGRTRLAAPAAARTRPRGSDVPPAQRRTARSRTAGTGPGILPSRRPGDPLARAGPPSYAERLPSSTCTLHEVRGSTRGCRSPCAAERRRSPFPHAVTHRHARPSTRATSPGSPIASPRSFSASSLVLVLQNPPSWNAQPSFRGGAQAVFIEHCMVLDTPNIGSEIPSFYYVNRIGRQPY